MKKLILCAALAMSLGACTKGVNSAGSVALTAEKSFGDAQIVFKGLQQGALACLTSHVTVCVTNKDKIIALVDKGQLIESEGASLIQAGNAASVGDQTTALLTVITGLQALGITAKGV